MSRNACTTLIALLGLGLIQTTRRLRRAEAELARLRAQRPPATTVAPASAPRTFAASGPDMSAEWEQAILPMDS